MPCIIYKLHQNIFILMQVDLKYIFFNFRENLYYEDTGLATNYSMYLNDKGIALLGYSIY